MATATVLGTAWLVTVTICAPCTDSDEACSDDDVAIEKSNSANRAWRISEATKLVVNRCG